MGYDLFPHKSGLGLVEPVALVDQNVCVTYANTKLWRRIIWSEALVPFQFLNIGAVAANAVSAPTPAANLQAWRNELLQIRWYPIDPVQVRLFLPNVYGRMSLRNIQVPIDPTVVNRDPCLHLTEFFVWEDRNPVFEAISYPGVGVAQCRLIGMGYRFVTEALPDAKIKQIMDGMLPCAYVPTSGFAGVS